MNAKGDPRASAQDFRIGTACQGIPKSTQKDAEGSSKSILGIFVVISVLVTETSCVPRVTQEHAEGRREVAVDY